MGILDTRDQLVLERTALDLLHTAPVQQSIGEVLDLYGADALFQRPSGRDTAEPAAWAIALAACQLTVTGDLSVPRWMWGTNAAHAWHGLDVPASGYGIDNPDNVHRKTRIEPSATYEITGRRHGEGPAQQSFILYGEIPGTGELTREGAPLVDVLTSDAIVTEEGGRYTITVGPEPAGNRTNHLCTGGTARLLIARDALADWSRQRPTELSIRQVEGPRHESPHVDELASRAGDLLLTIAPYWLAYNEMIRSSRDVNTIPEPAPRPFGSGAAAHFRFAEEECLLVTVDPLGAGYVGCQLADPWGVAPEYVAATGSLNNHQVRVAEDGTISYIVAARDPGVWNWLDTGGGTEGILVLRWQDLPADPDLSRAVRDVRVVPVDQVADLLGPTALVDACGRRQQLADRARSYATRLG